MRANTKNLDFRPLLSWSQICGNMYLNAWKFKLRMFKLIYHIQDQMSDTYISLYKVIQAISIFADDILLFYACGNYEWNITSLLCIKQFYLQE